MHKTNVLTFGSENFNTSLKELKDHLKFELTTKNINLENNIFEKYDVLFIHEDFIKNKNTEKKILEETNKIKILVSNSNSNKNINIFSDKLLLPTTIKDINQTVENSVAKKNFFKNSSIKIKDYILNKNEKKLIKKSDFILLTEKEIQLLELFLKNDKSITKRKVLEAVWKYASDADTHTVETHIYRLRKKIKVKFTDENFILNDKNGYFLWKKEIK